MGITAWPSIAGDHGAAAGPDKYAERLPPDAATHCRLDDVVYDLTKRKSGFARMRQDDFLSSQWASQARACYHLEAILSHG